MNYETYTLGLTLLYRYAPIFKIQTLPEVFMSTSSPPLLTNSSSSAEIGMIQKRENLNYNGKGKKRVRND